MRARPLAAARAQAAAAAATADHDRRLAPQTAEALTDAGFARHFVPRRWGGPEGEFAALVEAAAAVAEGCPSAAWCGMLWAAHSRFAAFLPRQGQREIWGASPDVRIAAAVMPPSGTAVPVGDTHGEGGIGWRVSGEWHTVSGVGDSDWVLLGAWEHRRPDDGPGEDPEEDPDGGPQEGDGDGDRGERGARGGGNGTAGPRWSRVFAVPAAEAGLTVRDTWDSVGLRGTGSGSVVANRVFVPRHRSFRFADLLSGTGAPDVRARCHTVPAQLAGGLMFAAPALGAARGALRVWIGWAAGGPPGGPANRDSASVRETLVRASAEIDAAGLLLVEAARRADTDPVTDLLVARNQRDAAIAADLLVTAVERLLRTGGAHARDGSGELSRLWRDVHTVAAHGVLRLEPAAVAYAAAALPASAGGQAPA